jgi:hypothetical protein
MLTHLPNATRNRSRPGRVRARYAHYVLRELVCDF